MGNSQLLTLELTEPQAPVRETNRREAVEWWCALIVTLVWAIAPAVIWPGDVTWMNDEPLLVAQAWHCNHDHVLASRGLVGSFPVPYGPLPIEIYQFAMLFTHDLRLIIIARAACCMGITALALMWLSRTLRLTPWFAVAVVCAPSLWATSRVLWDVSFILPIAMVTVAAYASFLRHGSGKMLALSVAGAIAVPLIHLQGLPLLAVIVGHAFLRHRDQLRRHLGLILAAIAPVFVLNFVYLIWLVCSLAIHLQQVIEGGHSGKPPFLTALLGIFMSGQLLYGQEMAGATLHVGRPATIFQDAVWVSLAIFPLIWVGMGVSLHGEIKRWRAGRSGSRTGYKPVSRETPARDTMMRLALIAAGLQLLMFAALRVPPAPHYFFALLPFYLLFAWVAIQTLQKVRLGLPISIAWGASLAFITWGTLFSVHQHGWLNSPTIGNQIEAAIAVQKYSDSSVMCDVPLYEDYSHAFRALTLIYARDPARPVHPSPNGLLLRRKTDPAAGLYRIELVEITNPTDVPRFARRMSVLPLPKWR